MLLWRLISNQLLTNEGLIRRALTPCYVRTHAHARGHGHGHARALGLPHQVRQPPPQLEGATSDAIDCSMGTCVGAPPAPGQHPTGAHRQDRRPKTAPARRLRPSVSPAGMARGKPRVGRRSRRHGRPCGHALGDAEGHAAAWPEAVSASAWTAGGAARTQPRSIRLGRRVRSRSRGAGLHLPCGAGGAAWG